MLKRTELQDILAGHPEGYSLPQIFYTSREVYALDLDRVWNRNWIWVGHVSQIPRPGDYFLFDYGPESLIILRDQEGEVRAHLNVCRHRGARICTERTGTARLLVCPYHAWTYELSGKLRAGQHMGAEFDPGKWGLHAAEVRVFQGMILVCASKTPPPIDAGLEALAPLTEPFGFERLKIAHTAVYPVPANWKLAVENYMECYHCAPAHLDYARSHTLKSPRDVDALTPDLKARSRAVGLPDTELGGFGGAVPGTEVFYRRYPLYEGYQTGSRTGAPLAPLLGRLTGYDGGATDVAMGMLNNMLVYSDHLVGYRFVPRDVQKTDIEVLWMVNEQAREGEDYDLEELIWLWDVTSKDDERIIRLNQAGVNSHFYRPGPLSEMEDAVQSFYDFYAAMLRTG